MENVIDIKQFKRLKRKKVLSECGDMIDESISLLRNMAPPLSLSGDDSNPYSKQINDVLSGLFLVRSKLQESNNNEEVLKNV